MGSDTIVEQIRKIRDDDSIKAIVLRIDSPGGSSVASDVIWRELKITRGQDDPDRPIVTSMSDLAASGGYYVAMPADAIVAQPGTLTGSIGIFGGKIVIGGTLEKAGVNTEAITSGANADIYSPFTPFTPAQRVKIEAFMQDFYKNFVGKVGGVTQDDSRGDSCGGPGACVDRTSGSSTRARRRTRRPRYGCRPWPRSARRFPRRRRAARASIQSVAVCSTRSRSSSVGQAAPDSGACWRDRLSAAQWQRSRRRHGCFDVESHWH